MTPSGFASAKMAVPATITLLPGVYAFIHNDPLLRWRSEPTCFGAYIDGFGSHTAIDLDVLVREPRAQLRDLGDAPLEELLTATALCAK